MASPRIRAKSVKIDADELLKVANRMNKMKQKVKPTLANAINKIGDSVIKETVRSMAQSTGLSQRAVRNMLVVKRATADNLKFSLDATKVMPPSGDWSRPFQRRVTPVLDANALVKIKTQDDEDVCPICEEAAADGPYTMEQAQAMHHGYTGLPGFLHPNCRCMIVPYRSFQRLPVTFGRQTRAQLLTAAQIGKAVAKDLKVILRV